MYAIIDQRSEKLLNVAEHYADAVQIALALDTSRPVGIWDGQLTECYAEIWHGRVSERV
jgi:hypothetical protein